MRRLIMIAGAALSLSAGVPPRERVVTGNGTVPARVNDVPLRLRIDPGALGMIFVGPEVAARAKLKGGLLGVRLRYAVGFQRVEGMTGAASIALDDGRTKRRRVGWTPLPYAAGVDAVIGPAGLDEPVVRFDLRNVRPGERTVAMPMAPNGGLFANWDGLYAMLSLGGVPVRVRFAPYQQVSTVTAITAQRLAKEYGGGLQGASGPVVIAFGFDRPVRQMVLARPWIVGPLSLPAVGVRVAEPGMAVALPEADAPAAEPDPDEVVVTAQSGKKPRAGLLVLGADQLERCSSIVFDKPAKVVRLTCLL